MSLKHVDLESALRRLADKRIEDAMREGKFSNLAGAGKPLELEPMPADENARMTWWMLRILKNNDFTPEEVRWRRRIDVLKDELKTAATGQRVEVLVKAINTLVRQLNTLGTNAINIAVSPVSLEEERRKLRERLAPPSQPEDEDEGPAPEAFSPVVPTVAAARAVPTVRCGNNQCRHTNPGAARFCRRCGKVLARA